jgi:aarF domain-containing kinase
MCLGMPLMKSPLFCCLFRLKRVLTAEFCEGCKVNNVAEIKKQGLSLKDVSDEDDDDDDDGTSHEHRDDHRSIITRHTLCALQTADKLICTFAEQIFSTGFIHADPHPGNGG